MTNLVLLIEAVQFAFIGALIVLAVLWTGIWLTDGILAPADVLSAFWMSCLVFAALLAGIAAVSILFFGNRYFAVYQADASCLYYEGSRGRDERPGFFYYIRAMPVVGSVRAVRTSGKRLAWEKADHIQDIPSMRVIIIKRGFWHILRLYTPDSATHEQVARYLKQRLEKK